LTRALRASLSLIATINLVQSNLDTYHHVLISGGLEMMLGLGLCNVARVRVRV
jgi:hypothetical protein